MQPILDLWGRIAQTLQDPTSNLTAALMLAAAAVLVVLIALVLVLAWVVSLGGDEESAEKAAERERRQAEAASQMRKAFSTPLLVGVVLAMAVAMAILYTRSGATSACLSCHAESSSAVTAWRVSPHAGVQCWDCHGGTGALGGLGARVAYVRWVRPGARADDPLTRARVSDSSCTACHDSIGDAESGDLRMSHAEPLAAGYRCTLCHGDTAHGEVAEVEFASSRMALCLQCHDGTKASADCEICHKGDVSQPGGTPPDRFPKVSMGPPTNCRGCHPIDTCNKCHGLELPHPVAFGTTGAHAKQAGFGGRPACMKCHDLVFCNRCHKFGTGHEGAQWRAAHGPEARREGGDARCRACHNRSENFCTLCHADGRRGR